MLNCSGQCNRLFPHPIFSGTFASGRRRYTGSGQVWAVFCDLEESDSRFQSRQLPLVGSQLTFGVKVEDCVSNFFANRIKSDEN